MVWRSGFEDWKAAESVREVADQVFRPPPLPTSPPISAANQPRIRGPAVTPEEAAAFKGVGPEPAGIGGWLVLIAIGQVLAPLKMIGQLLQHYSEVDPKLFQQFPATMWGEAAMNAGQIALMVYTAVLFFRHSYKFPLFFIYVWMSAIFLPLIAIVWAGVTISLYTGRPFDDFAKFEPQDVAPSIAAVIGAAVWITYIKKSRRVANTFTK